MRFISPHSSKHKRIQVSTDLVNLFLALTVELSVAMPSVLANSMSPALLTSCGKKLIFISPFGDVREKLKTISSGCEVKVEDRSATKTKTTGDSIDFMSAIFGDR